MRRLNVGCGGQAQPGWVNVDAVQQPGVDVVHDLDVFPWPFDDASFDQIRAIDIYEHVDKPIGFLGEVHRILTAEGTVHIHTTYFKNPAAFTDPTHKRFLTEASFDYWIPGRMLYERHNAAYGGFAFDLCDLHLDIAGIGDLNVTLRKRAG